MANNHDVIDLTLHGGGQGFEFPRLHLLYVRICRQNMERVLALRNTAIVQPETFRCGPLPQRWRKAPGTCRSHSNSVKLQSCF